MENIVEQPIKVVNKTKTHSQKENEIREKTFEEISLLFKKAEILDAQIKQFLSADEKLKNIILKEKSEKMKIDQDGTIESEADAEDYTLKIYHKNANRYDEPIVSISKKELIKQAAYVITREIDKAVTQRRAELTELLKELKK